MNLIALSLWQTRSKRASTAETSIPMKAASAVLNVRTVTVAKSGGNYGTYDVRWKVCQPG